MGSYAAITIDGYPILSVKNYLYQWYFKKSDRNIVTKKKSERNLLVWGEPDPDEIHDEEDQYVYEVNAKILKRRLELDGYTRSLLESEFKKVISARIQFIEKDEDRRLKYPNYLRVLKDTTLDEWLDKLRSVLQQKLRLDPWNSVPPYDDIIIEMLLHNPIFRYVDEGAMEIGFPCKTLESLARAFLEVVPEEAACVLDATDLVWGGWTRAFDDLEEYNKGFTDFYEVFEKGIDEIRGLMGLSPNNPVLAKLLYANVITAMETYLSDTAKKNVLSRPSLLEKFVETHKSFKDEKFSLAEIFKIHGEVAQKVSAVLEETAFHNLPKAINIFHNVFDASFPQEQLSPLFKAIGIRHDIVHRNGKDSSGKSIDVAMSDVEFVIEVVEATIRFIDKQIKDGLIDDDDIFQEPEI